MKCKWFIVIVLFVTARAYGQDQSFEEYMALGKKEFSKEFEAQDYAAAVKYFTSAVALKPKDQEAHYFLGYAYDRLSSKDGCTMMQQNLEATFKALVEFKTVIDLNPKYEGELVVLDPYAKITSLWGSMAWYYLANNKKDSAVWALKKGKMSGAFPEPVLELARNYLKNCSQNALLIVRGDLVTFPITYIQLIEGYRTDVQVLENGLINTDWYLKYLYNHVSGLFTLSLDVLMKLDFDAWTAQEMKIEVESSKYPGLHSFSWELKPSYDDKYLLRQDFVLLDILKKNKFKRDAYFAIGNPEENELSLSEYLMNEGLIKKIVPRKDTVNVYPANYDAIITGFACKSLASHKTLIGNSEDIRKVVSFYRLLLLGRIQFHQETKDRKKAKRLKKYYLKNFDESTVPYGDERLKYYADTLLSEV